MSDERVRSLLRELRRELEWDGRTLVDLALEVLLEEKNRTSPPPATALELRESTIGAPVFSCPDEAGRNRWVLGPPAPAGPMRFFFEAVAARAATRDWPGHLLEFSIDDTVMASVLLGPGDSSSWGVAAALNSNRLFVTRGLGAYVDGDLRVRVGIRRPAHSFAVRMRPPIVPFRTFACGRG